MKELLYKKLIEIVGEENLLLDEPMSKHTTFRIGGPADFFAMPACLEEVLALVKACKEAEVEYYIVGNGSNLLVGDKGFRGVIIQIGNRMADYTIEEREDGKYRVQAQAGIMLGKLAFAAANEAFKDFEFASGIPGTVGGAVAMNAGAYGGEIKDVLVSATVIDQEGNVSVLSKEELELGYRTSRVQKESLIVLDTEFVFEKGNEEEIKDRIKELARQRREKQPLEYPSAGSTFKRPVGHFAGKLIMDSGLRGYRVGNIMVSEKHCGFVINAGDGTAAEVLQLIKDVQRIVKEKYDVELEPEVRMIGSF